MKKIYSLLFLTVFFLCSLFSLTAHAETERSPVYPSDLKDGTYSITVDSSSSMFRIVDCQLTVSDGNMTAVMTLSGQGYGKLYMGTGEEALTASESEYIPFVVNDEEMYTYQVPVEALDQDTDCAAWSIRKEQWYDRTLVFETDQLPESAFQNGIGPVWITVIICGAGVVAAGAAITIGICCYKKKKAAR